MHSKGNHKQNEDTTCTIGENVCKVCDWQGIHFQNMQTTHIEFTIKKPNILIKKKMGRRLKKTFLERRHTDGQQAHEKNVQYH